MKKILFAAAEGAPFYKTGGLGDVIYALPKALASQKELDVRIVLPYYAKLMPEKYRKQFKHVIDFEITVGSKQRYVGIESLQLGGVSCYFVDNLEYFGRDALYGFDDDGERFGFYQMAVIEMLEKIDFVPDILHVNDWHTAFIPVLLKDKYSWITGLSNIKTVLTIHNIKFQGVYDPIVLESIFGIGRQFFTEDGFKYYDAINFLKGGIEFADKVTTVSPSYAQEIQTPEFGEGLDGVLRENNYKLAGFLNGIDTEIYDPQTDQNISANYGVADFALQKAKNKKQLQKDLNLPQENVPLFIIISRLTRQKGMDILLGMIDDFVVRHHVQFALLGTGDNDLERDFSRVQDRYPGQLSVNIKFDERLAQQMYAAGDFILVPSAFEPCGLSQMMGMRYGVVPVVHETGGLRDTVSPYNEFTDEGLGFSFASLDPQTLAKILAYAYQIYVERPENFKNIITRDMQTDFSWQKSAALYLGMYKELWGSVS